MKGAFECTHCGACCRKETSPVNITLGDVARMAKFLGKRPRDLIGREIRMRPFVNSESAGLFDIELGLPKPCPFWKEGRCSVYEARPLNCRLFPFWLFATFSDDEVKQQTLPGYDCVLNASVDDAHRDTYREYTRKIGALIMRESEATDAFIRENDLVQQVALPDEHERVMKVLAGPGPGTEQTFIELVRRCEERMDTSRYENLPGQVDAAVAKAQGEGNVAGAEELEGAERILTGRYVNQ